MRGMLPAIGSVIVVGITLVTLWCVAVVMVRWRARRRADRDTEVLMLREDVAALEDENARLRVALFRAHTTTSVAGVEPGALTR